MTAANIQITQGSGTRLATSTYTEGGVTVHDEKMILGEPYLESYIAAASGGISAATANSHLIQIMAGSSLKVRIRRIVLAQFGAPSGVSAFEMQILRVTTAGTGGGSLTPSKLDNADGAAGATAMTLPTAKGTEGAQLWSEALYVGTAAIPTVRNRLEWVQQPGSKPIIIPAGTANGIVVKNTGGLASLSFTIVVEFTESSF